MNWEMIGVCLAVVSMIAGVVYWMVRVSFHLGHIRACLENRLEELGNQSCTHEEKLSVHDRRLNQQAARITKLEQPFA